MIFQQQAQAEAVGAEIVGDDRQILGLLPAQGIDEASRDAD